MKKQSINLPLAVQSYLLEPSHTLKLTGGTGTGSDDNGTGTNDPPPRTSGPDGNN